VYYYLLFQLDEGGRRGHDEGGRRGHDEGGRRGHDEGGRRGHDEGGRRGHEGGRRGHDQKLFKKRLRLSIMMCAFSNKVIDNWNSLSGDCVYCKTINTFKKHLSPALESGAV